MNRYEYTLVLRALIFEERGKSMLSPSNWDYRFLETAIESFLALDRYCGYFIAIHPLIQSLACYQCMKRYMLFHDDERWA